jgi:hypothetical protein
MIHLIALTGLNTTAKRAGAHALATALHAHGFPLTVIDNGEEAARLPFPTLRIPTGCVCCGAAFGLYQAVAALERETSGPPERDQVALLITAASAMPEALRMIFGGLNDARVHPCTVGLAERWMAERMPYVLEQLTLHADHVVAVDDGAPFPASLVAAVFAALGLPAHSPGTPT